MAPPVPAHSRDDAESPFGRPRLQTECTSAVVKSPMGGDSALLEAGGPESGSCSQCCTRYKPAVWQHPQHPGILPTMLLDSWSSGIRRKVVGLTLAPNELLQVKGELGLGNPAKQHQRLCGVTSWTGM